MGEIKKSDVSYAKPRMATLAMLLFAATLLGAAISMVYSYHSTQLAQADLEELAKSVQTMAESPRRVQSSSIPQGIKTSFLFPAALAAGMFLLGVLASKGWRGAILAVLAAAIFNLAVSHVLYADLNWRGAAQYAGFLLTLALCSRMARGIAAAVYILILSVGWILFCALWPVLMLTANLNLATGFTTFALATPDFSWMLKLLAATAPFAIAWMIATRPAPAKKAS